MKVVTAEQMRELDKWTIEAGIPGSILMENAGSRVVDGMLQEWGELDHVAVVCGKGNNGGDGFVVARQLWTRQLCRKLTVYELFDPATLTGDAASARKMLAATGCPVERNLPNEPNWATVVVDAVLGTGLNGPPTGVAGDAIRIINTQFAHAQVVAVDLPSGLPGDEFVEADLTVTFTAPKPAHVFHPVGKLIVAPIGTPETKIQSQLNVTAPDDLRDLFVPRIADSNKGLYGHVLVVGGSYGKSGAPAMAGLGSFRMGAGLVTVAVPDSVLPIVAGFRPELMTVPARDAQQLLQLAAKMTVVALGPGLGGDNEAIGFVRSLYAEAACPLVLDADGLNILAGEFPHTNNVRVLTPHPGEMGRLAKLSVKEVQADRLGVAQRFAKQHNVAVVLKGDRTVIAFPDGETWINPTGSPSMSTGGTGDILTGMVSGLIAQFPKDWKRAVIAAVWLHGRCGELASDATGEQYVLATDLLEHLPEAMDELRP